MKKFLIWICMITCIFGLTACGSEETLTQREREYLDIAEQRATKIVIPALARMIDDEQELEFFNGRTMEEIEYLASERHNIQTDGYAFATAIDSFDSAIDSVGDIFNNDNTVRYGEITSRIDGDQIIIEAEVIGTNKNAVAEIIFANDIFMHLESAALNPVSGMGELMTGAALNTLIGMGTVFVVLILISAIISCFKVINKLQNTPAENKTAKPEAAQSTKADSVVAQPVVQEESADDLELAAVIAAAIAAYEGSASTDGYVVRSIRRRR